MVITLTPAQAELLKDALGDALIAARKAYSAASAGANIVLDPADFNIPQLETLVREVSCA